jgi:hypothetical protein
MTTAGEFERRASTWSGWVVFAGVILFTVGCLNVIQGLVGIFKDDVNVITSSGLIVTTDFTTWGIVILIWGAIMILAGLGLFSGAEWARWFGIVVVALNIIIQFAYFPAFPLWSMVIIGLNAAVLFGLTARWEYARAALRD